MSVNDNQGKVAPSENTALNAEAPAGESVEQQESALAALPEHLRDPERLAESYAELNSRIGELRSEVGTLRTFTTDILKSERDRAYEPAAVAQEEELTFSPEDLFEDPTRVINAAIARATKPLQDDLAERRRRDELNAEELALSRDHPDYIDVAQSAEFRDWVNARPSRQAMMQRAAAEDYDAGRLLLDEFKDSRQSSAPNTAHVKDAQAHAIGKPGGAASTAPALFSQADMIDLLVRDKEAYRRQLPAFKQALVDGRVGP